MSILDYIVIVGGMVATCAAALVCFLKGFGIIK